MTLHLQDVRFAYPDAPDHIVLDIKHWSLQQGEQVFVHGPSGCGKSTLLNILGGLLPVNEGQVSVLGTRLDQLSARQRDRFRANHIGYVCQQFNLIPYLDAVDNIRLAAHFGKRAAAGNDVIKALLADLQIAESEWHKPASRLSIGQQQRVAIARALINQPELLIADEPTSSLDQHNRDNFLSLLMPLVEANNISLLFVSHDMSLAQHFARVDALATINRRMEVTG